MPSFDPDFSPPPSALTKDGMKFIKHPGYWTARIALVLLWIAPALTLVGIELFSGAGASLLWADWLTGFLGRSDFPVANERISLVGFVVYDFGVALVAVALFLHRCREPFLFHASLLSVIPAIAIFHYFGVGIGFFLLGMLAVTAHQFFPKNAEPKSW